MKNKFILCLLAFVCLLATQINTHAQAYSSVTLSLPNTYAVGTTNLATPLVIGPIRQQNLALSGTVSSSGAATNILTLQKSVDGVNYDSVNTITATNYTATGAATTTSANISVQGYGFLRVYSITTGGNTITNNSLSYGIKLLSP